MRVFTVVILLLLSVGVFAQRKFNIVKVVDDLRVQWDQAAISLKDYSGIQNFCHEESYRVEIIQLLDDIHHWDTTLYFIVQSKYENNQDEEAAATLSDIEALEREYSTQNFKHFIQNECEILKEINETFDSKTLKKHEKDIKVFEKELVKYINSITYRIDIIDEHIHHLKLD